MGNSKTKEEQVDPDDDRLFSMNEGDPVEDKPAVTHTQMNRTGPMSKEEQVNPVQDKPAITRTQVNHTDATACECLGKGFSRGDLVVSTSAFGRRSCQHGNLIELIDKSKRKWIVRWDDGTIGNPYPEDKLKKEGEASEKEFRFALVPRSEWEVC